MAVEPAPCPLTAFPAFPETHADVCGENVCLPPADVAQIWQWARDVQRWSDLATTCLGGRP